MKILFLILFLCSCSGNPFDKDNKPEEPVVPKPQQLKNKRIDYLVRGEAHVLDEYGAISRGNGMLWSCLKHAAGGRGVQWRKFHKEGHPYWMIRSRHYEPENVGKPGVMWSWYSADEVVGELTCVWTDQDLEWLENRIEWLEANDWDVCGGREYADSYTTWLGRCKMKANLKATYYEILYRLGGANHRSERARPQIWNPKATGVSAHLTVLQFLLRGIMMDGINDLQIDFLRSRKQKNPGNSLYHCAYHLFTDQEMDVGISQLLGSVRFPNGRLPNSTDKRCTHYLFQREQYIDDKLNKDWKSCPEVDPFEEYHGVDLAFAASVCLGDVYMRD